ncbi:hypothetical protein PLICRDRAFT_311900 [Plicaturopsis crispa FD-325 SS-3]|nr:hypothetical protein PLICRDRAFT_311900 [Plicaturopsis crispa FD-325 SS-3]
MPSLESFAKASFGTAAGLTTVGLGLLWYGQNFLIYPSAFPPGSRTEVPVPTDYDLPHEDLELETPDKVLIRSYLLVQRKDIGHAAVAPQTDAQTDEEFAATRPTVIMFHGNGGNHGHRLPLARVFYKKMRCNVLMLSYRGYGLSEGSPSEKGLKIDAQTALDYLTSHPCFSQTAIILYGQSIGGAVAIDLASRNPSKIRALIVENTFLSLPQLIPHALPLLSPFSWLCHQKWDSASKLHLIPKETPVLMLSGARDEVVPASQMRDLWDLFLSTRGVHGASSAKAGSGSSAEEAGETGFAASLGSSKFVQFERGSHNDTCVQQGYWQAVEDFVRALNAPRS